MCSSHSVSLVQNIYYDFFACFFFCSRHCSVDIVNNWISIAFHIKRYVCSPLNLAIMSFFTLACCCVCHTFCLIIIIVNEYRSNAGTIVQHVDTQFYSHMLSAFIEMYREAFSFDSSALLLWLSLMFFEYRFFHSLECPKKHEQTNMSIVEYMY